MRRRANSFHCVFARYSFAVAEAWERVLRSDVRYRFVIDASTIAG